MAKKKKNYKRYGMVKPKTGAKLCWISSQNKHGWSLGLALGGYTIWLKNTRFASQKEIARVMKSKVVFIKIKNL